MSLSQALAAAVSGLRASQTGLSLVAGNVANANTPGYVRKTSVLVTTAAGDSGSAVRVSAVNRELDTQVQRQLRTETSGVNYADLSAQFYSQLQGYYGTPGGDGTLETVLNNFTSSLQTLSTSPDSGPARDMVLSSAQSLTQELNGLTSDVQGLRTNAEFGLADAVTSANDSMTALAKINQQLGAQGTDDGTTANLLDQRDHYLDQLAQLMDINVVESNRHQVTVTTNSGVELVGPTAAATLAFDAKGTMSPTAAWSADPTQRGVGTLVLQGSNGGSIDLIATKAIRSGQIAAYLNMRDQVLPQAQSQLDQIAAGLSSALSDRTTGGTAVSSGAQSGYNVDLSGIQNGNAVHVTYTDVATNTQHTLTLIRVDDPAARPLPDSTTPDPNDKVIGLDFSGGAASVASQLNAALGTTGLTFSNPSGSTLSILDNGLNKASVNAASATTTTTTLAGGSAQLPFFLDGNSVYTGAISSYGSQATGLAGRITVNGGLLADPSKLVTYQTSPATPAGDSTRPNFIYDAIANTTLTFAPQSGVGTTVAPFSGTVQSFVRQVISQQGSAAQSASDLKQGQDVVYNSLQQRFNDGAGVNIDQEMSNLLNLQNAYSANARVLSTVKQMLDTLMNI